MFDDLLELWKRYEAKHAHSWQPDDPRHDLSAEVRERLVQLNIVVEYLKAALMVFCGDPAEKRRDLERMIEAKTRLDSGEITRDEYFARLTAPKSQEQLRDSARAADEVRLFTETFYFVAWRLKEALTAGGALAFHGFSKFNPSGVNLVRNHLLEHPERHSRNFRQHILVTHTGPVLKALAMVLHSPTGRTEPESESIDQGLFKNAQEFHDELEQRLRKELS